jgi:hypothetical protein
MLFCARSGIVWLFAQVDVGNRLFLRWNFLL